MTIFVVCNCEPNERIPDPIQPPILHVELKGPTTGPHTLLLIAGWVKSQTANKSYLGTPSRGPFLIPSMSLRPLDISESHFL